jgi:hypothetical protein
MFFVDYIIRYVDALLYGLKSRKAAKRGDRASQYKYYAYMINEDADSTLLRLFEAFMESAPQVTLQLYILIYYFNDPKGPFADRSCKEYFRLRQSKMFIFVFCCRFCSDTCSRNVSCKSCLVTFCLSSFTPICTTRQDQHFL